MDDDDLNNILVEAYSARDDGQKASARMIDMLRASQTLDNAYLFKYRVKDKDSIINKIKTKRESGRKNYSVSDITDIVGIRLLTLFKAELPGMVSSFLDFMSQNCMTVFGRENLTDVIDEAIVYLPNRNYDQAYDLVIKEFAFKGISTSTTKRRGSLFVDRKDDNEYSSIHIVARVIITSRESRKSVPVEVQIRTAFEDLWSEIDHRLIYKNDMDSVPHFKGMSNPASTVKNLSSIIKRYMDATSDSCDHLKTFVTAPGAKIDRHPTSTQSINLTSFEAMLRDVLGEEASPLIETIRRAYDSNGRAKLEGASEAIKALSSEQVATKLAKSERYLYLQQMEIALLNIAAADALQDLRDLKDTASSSETIDGTARYIENAIGIYSGYIKNNPSLNDPIIYYRMYDALLRQGRYKIAIGYLEEAFRLMISPSASEWMTDHDLTRLNIPVELATEYYLVADKLKEDAEEIIDVDAKIGISASLKETLSQINEERKKYLERSLAAISYISNVDPSSFIRKTNGEIDVFRLSRENMIMDLYALWTSTETENSKKANIGNIDFDRANSAYEFVRRYYDENPDAVKVEMVDSLRNFADARDDGKAACEFAMEVIRRLDAKATRDPSSTSTRVPWFPPSMRRDALRTLEKFGKPS